jgi:hypothetical protein
MMHTIIKFGIVIANATFNRVNRLFTRKLDSILRKKLVKCCIWSSAFCGAETLTLRKVNQN